MAVNSLFVLMCH